MLCGRGVDGELFDFYADFLSDLEAAANLHPHDRGASNLCGHAGGYSQVRFGNPPHRSNDLVLGNPGQERLKDDLRLQPPRSWRLDLLRPDHLSELARTAPTRIAEELGCHPKTVRRRLHRFNADGMGGLGDRPGAGRKPRITEDERSRIMALVSKDPPGRLLRYDGLPPEALDETQTAYWTLDALADAAQEMSIEVGRGQVRRILLSEGVRWCQTQA